jgi:hypothetical protein
VTGNACNRMASCRLARSAGIFEIGVHVQCDSRGLDGESGVTVVRSGGIAAGRSLTSADRHTERVTSRVEGFGHLHLHHIERSRT